MHASTHTVAHNAPPPPVFWRCQCTFTVVMFLLFSFFARFTRNGGPKMRQCVPHICTVYTVPNSTGACVPIRACAVCVYVHIPRLACMCVWTYNHIRPYIEHANIVRSLLVVRYILCWCSTASAERCVVDAAHAHTHKHAYTRTATCELSIGTNIQAPKKHRTNTQHITLLGYTIIRI